MTRGRSAVFMLSDVGSAAFDFVEALSEHADTVWELEDKDALAEALTDASIAVLRDPGMTFVAREEKP